MDISKYIANVQAVLVNLLRHWLIVATILFLGIAIAAQPSAWAAPVAAPKNQTVPPGDFRHYLPLIKLNN